MPKTASVFVNSIQVSVLVGIGLCGVLLLFSKPMLQLLIGSTVTHDPQLLSLAQKYVCIRAMGMPAAAMIGTAQAACLGMQDVKSALRVFGISAIVNLVVDLALVRHPNTWIGGVAGAAWATVLSQYFAGWLFVKWLCDDKKDDTMVPADAGSTNRFLAKFQSILKRKGSVDNPEANMLANNSQAFSTRAFLAGKFGFKQILKRPCKEISKGFTPYVLPVITSEIGRCSTYAAMGHVVSSVFGTISMAANQIILSIFYALIPIADSLCLTAQSLIPGIVARSENQSTASEPSNRHKILWQTTKNFAKAAVLTGFVQAGLVATIPSTGNLFTTDKSVLNVVNKIVPILLPIFASHGIFCVTEGILLGHRDLTFLGRMYGLFFAVVPLLMLNLKRLAIAGNEAINLVSVWQLFLGYQAFRISAWVGRVLWMQRKVYRQDIGVEAIPAGVATGAVTN